MNCLKMLINGENSNADIPWDVLCEVNTLRNIAIINKYNNDFSLMGVVDPKAELMGMKGPESLV